MSASLGPACRPKRWRRLSLAALAALLVVGGLLLGRARQGPPPPVPPDVPPELVKPDVAAAISRARQAVQQNPRSASAWGLLGKVLLAHGLPAQAEPCLRQAEKLDGADSRWPYYLGLVARETDPGEAVACFRRAVERGDRAEPEVTAPRLQFAALLLQEARTEEAEQVLQPVRAREPDNPHLVYLSGLLCANRNDLKGSVTLLQRLTDSPFARNKACARLAQLYERLGDGKSAEAFDRRRRLLPADARWPDPYYAEVLALNLSREQSFAPVFRLMGERRFDEAVAELERLIEDQEPALPQAYQLLGTNLAGLHRYAEAEEAFRAALRLQPDDTNLHHTLAMALVTHGEDLEENSGNRQGAQALYRQAAVSAREALRLNPYLAGAQLTLGEALLHLGERQDGVAALRLAVRCRPDLSRAHLLLGEALAEDGRTAEALDHLRNAVRFADPKDQRPGQALQRWQNRPSP